MYSEGYAQSNDIEGLDRVLQAAAMVDSGPAWVHVYRVAAPVSAPVLRREDERREPQVRQRQVERQHVSVV